MHVRCRCSKRSFWNVEPLVELRHPAEVRTQYPSLRYSALILADTVCIYPSSKKQYSLIIPVATMYLSRGIQCIHPCGYNVLIHADTMCSVHPQNVRFQNVRFQNVRFQNVRIVRFSKCQIYKTSGLQIVRSSKCPVAKSPFSKKHVNQTYVTFNKVGSIACGPHIIILCQIRLGH